MFSNPIPVYVKNNELVEREFFARELNLIFVNKPEPLSNGTVFVACTEPQNWISFLLEREEKSVVFFLLGNETYDIHKYEFFNNFPSIKHVFIYNPPRRNVLYGVKAILGFIFDDPISIFSTRFYRSLKNAFDFALRSRNLKLRYQWTEFPLGYTNRFIRELKAIGLISDFRESVFNIKEIDLLKSQKKVGFIGQSGSWVRQRVLFAVQKSQRVSFALASNWGGKNDVSEGDYAKSIINCRANLVPPGNLTNQTFRYAECLVLWRLPSAPPITIQDHHYNRYWTELEGNNLKFHSYVLLTRFLLKIDDTEYRSLLVKYRSHYVEELSKIRAQIIAM